MAQRTSVLDIRPSDVLRVMKAQRMSIPKIQCYHSLESFLLGAYHHTVKLLVCSSSSFINHDKREPNFGVELSLTTGGVCPVLLLKLILVVLMAGLQSCINSAGKLSRPAPELTKQKRPIISDACTLQANPDVPVVENLEDIWLVGKLQKERQAKRQAQERQQQLQQYKQVSCSFCSFISWRAVLCL